PGYPRHVNEVTNYVRAMNHGLARLTDLPVSVRLIREIHAVLMQRVRGGRLTPGELRTSQNWTGPGGRTLANATFVPPPPHEVPRSEEHTSELQSREKLVCRLLLEKKKD